MSTSLSPTDAVVIGGARTPIGRAHRGSLIDVDPIDLAQIVSVASGDEGVPLTAEAVQDRLLRVDGL